MLINITNYFKLGVDRLGGIASVLAASGVVSWGETGFFFYVKKYMALSTRITLFPCLH